MLLLGEEPARISKSDAVLHVCGQYMRPLISGISNIIWLISNPQLLTPALARQYQHVFVSSIQFLEHLDSRGIRNASYLPQCTDLEEFSPPQVGAERPIKYFFAGNMRADFRRGNVELMLHLGAEIEIVGRGWKKLGHPTQPVAEWIQTKELAGKYRKSRFVFNNHRRLMGDFGFTNNRMFDALACGARVISDETYIPPEFKDYVIVLRNEEMHRQNLERLERLPPIAPADIVELRKVLQQTYSFDHAAAQIIDKAKEIAATGRAHKAMRDILAERPPAQRKSKAAIIVLDDADIFRRSLPLLAEHLIWQANASVPDASVIVSHSDLPLAASAMPDRDLLVALSPYDRVARDDGTVNSALADFIRRYDFISQIFRDRNLSARAQFVDMAHESFDSSAEDEIKRALVKAFADLEKTCITELSFSMQNFHAALLGQAEASAESICSTAVDYLDGLAARFDADVSTLNPAEIVANYNRAAPQIFYDDITRNLAYHLAIEARFSGKLQRLRLPAEQELPQLPTISIEPRANSPRLDSPIGVFIHVYYLDTIPALKGLLEKLPVSFDLHISTDTEDKKKTLEQEFADRRCIVRVFQNRGRDIYPKIFGWKEEHARYEIALHLHGKQSPHVKEAARTWFEDVADCLVPDAETVNSILALFKNVRTIGMIGPRPYPPIANNIHWRNNAMIGRAVLHRMNLSPDLVDQPVRFPAGSMFWCRPAALKSLFDLDFRADDFPAERGQLDGTLGHALERCLSISCLAAGLKYLEIAPQREGQGQLGVKAIRDLLGADAA